ncbi:MAG: ribosome maturation factor RimM [Bacteroidota bacterium]|nr:ribosome maturation factor RimM [Bacteroidota bacterium]MDP4232697.1 ribosome maturation factor RimM [Bacteroidota bacterium]MDP4243170.1 ribosome maturation factor RimM [Bacteroidota bacterium]MDP4287627.1 ribosome maturation factor RimM [Bacteroidota bacterium]
MTTELPDDYVLIARIRKPHGLQGELEIESFTWDEGRFGKLKRVFLRNAEGIITEQIVESARPTNRGVLIRFQGVQDRDAADGLRGAEMFIPESERPKLPEGRAYYDEIIGMYVIDDVSGTAIGRVTNVLNMPAGDVFVLDINGQEHLVSNAGDEIVKIDTAKNEVRVRLLEEY